MTDQLTSDFRTYLPIRLFCYPNLAKFACQQIIDRLTDDPLEVMPPLEDGCYLASVEIGGDTYFALILDFPDRNLLAESHHLEKLERICSISHQITGLAHVAAVHRKHGVMAEIAPESEVKFILWSF